MNNINNALAQMVELTAANNSKVAVLGARAVVLGKFHEAVLPYLTTPQRAAITTSFRQGVEDAMGLMDDVALPAEYHSALLELTNSILAALGRERPGGQ